MTTDVSGHATHAADMIPGAYERNTLTFRQPGSMSGPAFGSATAPIGGSSLDAATVAEREKEGGGGVSQRSRKIDVSSQGGRRVMGAEHNDSRMTRGYLWFRMLLVPR
jgi:hypothetical protein